MKLNYRWASLIVFFIQNSLLVIVLRLCAMYSSQVGDYITTTAVLFAEIIKALLSLVIIFITEADSDRVQFVTIIKSAFIDDYYDCIRLSIPSVLYCIQNNLQYIIDSAPLFLVVYQLKIVTTAIFYATVLANRRLPIKEWMTIVLLALGVSMVESSQKDIQSHHPGTITGMVAVIIACFTSGFAGVYFEKIVKSSRSSIWVINLQMSIISCLISIVSAHTVIAAASVTTSVTISVSISLIAAVTVALALTVAITVYSVTL